MLVISYMFIILIFIKQMNRVSNEIIIILLCLFQRLIKNLKRPSIIKNQSSVKSIEEPENKPLIQ